MFTHTYIRMYINTYIHTNIHTYKHTYIHTYMHTYILFLYNVRCNFAGKSAVKTLDIFSA